jgi:outer membrane protein
LTGWGAAGKCFGMSAAARLAASVFALSTLVLATEVAAQPAPAQPAPAAQPAPVALRIAVLDTQKVLRETEEGMRIESNLRKLFDNKQADLLNKQKQLQQEYEDVLKEEKKKGKSDAALDKKKAELEQKFVAYQQAAGEFQREFARKQNEMYNPMLQKLGNIVKALAQTDGFDLVIDKQAAIHFRRDLDVTERVIQAYNAGEGGTAKTKKPEPEKKPAAPAAAKKP